MQFTRTHH